MNKENEIVLFWAFVMFGICSLHNSKFSITQKRKNVNVLLMKITMLAIISAITLVMCFGAVIPGKKIGTKLNSKAEIIGGIVLILIAIRLLIDGL